VNPGVTAPVDVIVHVLTRRVPNGNSQVFGTTVPATLRFRAVGTDGAVVEADGVVGLCECPAAEEGVATATLVGLNPGATYQVVVTPQGGAFQLALAEPGSAPLRAIPHVASVPGTPTATPSTGFLQSVGERSSEPPESDQLAQQWARAFGVELKAPVKLAQITVMTSDKR